jgi:lysophospholipase L1-like esterase
MSRRILCFGDSNTWGFDPRDPIEKRYPPESRWPDLLAEATGWEVINMGLNGRTIPHRKSEVGDALSRIRKRLPLDCLILMLGSNDAVTMDEPSSGAVARRMDAFLSALRREFPELPILLISPPLVEIPLAHVQELFRELIPKYRALASRHMTRFASAPSWQLPLSPDWVHFSPEAHQIFALKVKDCLRDFL